MIRFHIFVAYVILLLIWSNCSHMHDGLITSDLPGAHVFLDNEFQGDTPCVIKWPQKDRNVEFTVAVVESGYSAEQREVYANERKLNFILQPFISDQHLPSAEEQSLFDTPPILLKPSSVEYPPLAKQTRIQGIVWVKVLVDNTGKVQEAKIHQASGVNAGFEEAALKSAYQCEYKPALKDKKPVAVWITYPVKFSLK